MILEQHRIRAARGIVPALLAAGCLLLAGCAAPRAVVPSEPRAAACVNGFERLARAIETEGVRDAGEAPVRGFPYLRTNRVLASLAVEARDEPARFAAWVAQLAELDGRARRIEIGRLSAERRATLPDAAEQESCRALLLAHDAADATRRELLAARATVPDDYLPAWRVAGLYPVAALFVTRGIARWHREARSVFATPLAELPVAGQLQRWSSRTGHPLEPRDVRGLLDPARDPLDIPRLAPPAAARLLDAFAPVWEIDVVQDADRIGTPRAGNPPTVDTTQPVEYRMLAHTRHAGRVLLQLVYVIWLPARPGRDLYAGALDGLTWRVTLAADGRVLMHDSIHNCGCYHQFFPGAGLELRADLPRHYFEQPLVPQPAPEVPLVVRLSHTEHYIQRVYHDDDARPVTPLASAPYDLLRGAADGVSLFGPNGLVRGTERGERFLLWPMGIRSPGAMRQWGRQPVAFVGRRHFDEPWLFERLFEAAPATAGEEQ